MTKDEALRMALEALIVSLPDLKGYWKIKAEDAITAIKEALAQSEQEETTVSLDDPSFLLFQMKRNYPPECTTEAEKNAFAFGWWKAMEELKNK